MTLGLTEEHLQLAEAVSAWAQRHCPADTVRAAADGPDSGSAHYLASLAPGLAEQGLLGLHVPEEDGGQGYGLPELAVAVEELGRALVPGAFLPTVFASAALVAAGLTGKLVTGLADGSKTGAVGLVAGLTGTRDGDGDLVIDGESGPVLGGSLADLVILPVQTDVGEVWAAIDAAGLDITALDSLDLTRPLARVRAARAARARPGRPAADRPEQGRGDEPGGDPVRRRGVRHRRLGHPRRQRVRQDPAPVRPADRPVPGGQAPLRANADRGRAGSRSGLGRGPRGTRRAARVRRRGGRGGGAQRRRLVRAPVHPGPRRNRLHLGARGPPVLPPGDVAACPPRPVRRLG